MRGCGLAARVAGGGRCCDEQQARQRTRLLHQVGQGVAVEFGQGALRLGEMLGGHDQFTADPVNLLGRVHCLRGDARKAIDHAARNVGQMHRLGNRIEEAAMSGVLVKPKSMCSR